MKISTKTIVTVGMFAAVLGILSILSIPVPGGVPVTLQTFAVALCGYVLGWKRGLAAVFIYVLIGAAGIPVYAGMGAGPAVLFGPSGGFLFGFLLMAPLCGIGMNRKNVMFRLMCGIAGLLICHLCGGIQFSLVTGSAPAAAFLTVSLPYLVKDVLSVAGAYFAALPIRKALASILFSY